MKQDNCKTTARFAVVTGMGVGILIHLFGLANVLVNQDNVLTPLRGYGAGATSGRWFLQVLGELMHVLQLDFNLPAVNGLIYLLLLSVAAGVFVAAFEMKNRTAAGLVGLVFVSFPTVCATMFFRFTVIYYGLSALLAVTAVWVLPRHKLGFVFSAVCVTLSMGIYQAYVPLTIGMSVLLLLKKLLSGELDLIGLVRKGITVCAAIFAGAAGYYVCTQLFLRIYQVELSGYQGISEMGRIPIRSIPRLVISAYQSFFSLPTEDYCGLGTIPLMRYAYAALFVVICAMVTVILWKKKDWLTAAAALALLAVFPLAVNFIVVMSPAWVHTLMLFSFVLVLCAPLVLWEVMPEMGVLPKIGAVTVAVLVFLYGYYTNVNYSALHSANEQTAHYMTAMVAQVRMTEGYDTDKTWVFIGSIEDPQLDSVWAPGRNYEGNSSPYILMNYTRPQWLHNYLGYAPQIMDFQEGNKLASLPEVRVMPCWPAQGSIQVIDNLVIIKCSELIQE